MQNHLGGMDNFRDVTVKIVRLISWKVVSSKRKEHAVKSRPLFRMGLMYRNTNRKSQKISLLSKMLENLPSVSSPLIHCRLNELPPQYILEESIFSFRYVRLCDLDIPREKWFNFLQTVETLIRHRILQCLRCLQITFLGVSRLQSVKFVCLTCKW